jgi:hypothetical protein
MGQRGRLLCLRRRFPWSQREAEHVQGANMQVVSRILHIRVEREGGFKSENEYDRKSLNSGLIRNRKARDVVVGIE